MTQTETFAAAVAGAPLTNMVSMYSLIYKNTGGTNQAIFESSQGRFKGGYWDNWDAYYRNSPVFFAKNVKTPLKNGVPRLKAEDGGASEERFQLPASSFRLPASGFRLPASGFRLTADG